MAAELVSLTGLHIPDYARCRHLADHDASITVFVHKYREESDPCAPIIDAEKSNEALQMVARIRRRAGPDFMAFSAERDLLSQRR
jgi:hypothetical protein